MLEQKESGLYCAAGDFYIDPWRPVMRAVITHGHSDHARAGMGEYFTTTQGLPILQWRLGRQKVHVHDYSERFTLGDAHLSFHPAGHVLGSAQVRVEVAGEVWVVSGDYKRQIDPTCEPFEVVRCDTFITEATFALPVYTWPDTMSVIKDIMDWWRECQLRNETAILYVYSLGKAQRILGELADVSLRTVQLHGAIASAVEIYRKAGIRLADTELVSQHDSSRNFVGDLVLAPPSAAGTPWLRRFPNAQQGFASGWMQIRGNRRRRNMDRGFVLSDHIDWPDLIQTIKETGAQQILATHGDSRALVRFLNEQGYTARSLPHYFNAATDEE